VGSTGFNLVEHADLAHGGCILEIGSDRGEGSTLVLLAAARRHGVPFFSIDVKPDVSEKAAVIPGVAAVCGRGEDVLADWGDRPEPRFCWMDGYDWPYSFADWAWQVAEYAQRGDPLTCEASQESHLAQAVLVHRLTSPGAIAVFDDTWATPSGWSGKGGTAVPWLTGAGWAAEASGPPILEPPGGDYYVQLRKAG